MHRVRAYRPIFDFCSFLSVALNKLFAVFFIYYICGFTKEFIAFGSLASNALPYQLRPDCQSLCQVWCESIQYWASYFRLTDFRRLTTPSWIFVNLNVLSYSVSQTPFSAHIYRIQCKYVQ